MLTLDLTCNECEVEARERRCLGATTELRHPNIDHGDDGGDDEQCTDAFGWL